MMRIKKVEKSGELEKSGKVRILNPRILSHNEKLIKSIKFLPFRYLMQVCHYIDWRYENPQGYNIVITTNKTFELYDFSSGIYVAIKNEGLQDYDHIINELVGIPCIEFHLNLDRKPNKAEVWQLIEPHLPKDVNIRKKTLQKIREGLKRNDTNIILKKMFLVKNKISQEKLMNDDDYKKTLYNLIYDVVKSVKLPFSTIDYIDLIHDIWLELLETGNEKLYQKVMDGKIDEVKKMLRKHMYNRIKNFKNQESKVMFIDKEYEPIFFREDHPYYE